MRGGGGSLYLHKKKSVVFNCYNKSLYILYYYLLDKKPTGGYNTSPPPPSESSLNVSEFSSNLIHYIATRYPEFKINNVYFRNHTNYLHVRDIIYHVYT